MSPRINVETRATIIFCVKLGMTPTQMYGTMTAANMNYKVSRRLIFKWPNVSEMVEKVLRMILRAAGPLTWNHEMI